MSARRSKTRARKANSAWTARVDVPDEAAENTGAIGMREPCSCEFEGDCFHVSEGRGDDQLNNEDRQQQQQQRQQQQQQQQQQGSGALSLDTILVVGSVGSGGGALPSAPRLGEGVSGEDCLSISGAVQQHEHEHPGKQLFPSYHGIRCKARLCHGVPFPAASAPASTRQEGGGVGTQYYTMEQVSTHCTMTDCWLAAGGKVYDSTDFLQLHPGGAGSIMRRAGGNATQDMKFHSAKSMRFWKAMEIGFVCQCVPKGMKKHPGGRQASSCSVQ